MPQNVRYTAVRSLIAGHSLEGVYYLNLTLKKKDRMRKTKRIPQEMLNGDIATTYYNGRDNWRCQTIPLAAAAANNMREFLDSVEDGQHFLFSPTGWVGDSPSGYVNVVLTSAGYTESRTERGPGADLFSFSFEMAVTP